MTLVQEEIVAQRFDLLADRFKESLASDDYRLLALNEALGPLLGLRLLDLGCGKGRFATELERLGANVVGLDRSRVMLAHAGLKARVRASAFRLPFADETFNVVCAIEVLQHLPFERLPDWIAETTRVLKPGGRLALIDRNLWALDDRRPWLPSVALKRLDERRGRWMYRVEDKVQERWASPRGLQRMLEQNLSRVCVRMLIRPEEKGRWLFENLPLSRRMALWTGEKQGGTRG